MPTSTARLNPIVSQVTSASRSQRKERSEYLAACRHRRHRTVPARDCPAGNLAHGFAASSPADKDMLKQLRWPNLAIVTAYNDMLSRTPTFRGYPGLIRTAAREAGATAQVAGGVPAMCDGVTQGQSGMNCRLFSLDVIAMSTGIALSHGMFDGTCAWAYATDRTGPAHRGAGIRAPACDLRPCGSYDIRPGQQGKGPHRQLFAEGKATRDELLQCEADSYHSAGTCTFYGRPQQPDVMEVMGLHMPGSAFVNPNTALRDLLTRRRPAAPLKSPRSANSTRRWPS